MRTHITILAIIFVVFAIVSSDAFDEKANGMPTHKQFPEMNEHNYQYPPGIKCIKNIEGRAPRFMKNSDRVQSADDYLVESIRVYTIENNVIKDNYTYNENKQIIAINRKILKNREWIHNSRDTCIFDEHGNLLISLFEVKRNDKWIDSLRYSFTYDSDSNLLTYEKEMWEGNIWQISWKYIMTYDEDRNVSSQLFESWGHNYLIIFTYDEYGNKIAILSKVLKNDEWVISSRTTNTFDEAGNLLTHLSERWKNEEWANLEEYSFTYDSESNELTMLLKYWKNEEWVNYSITTSVYDSDGNRLKYFNQFWTNEEWRNTWKTTQTYDSDGNQLTNWGWHWKEDRWINTQRFCCIYDEYDNLRKNLCEKRINDEWIIGNGNFYFEDSNGNSYGSKNEISWNNVFTSVEIFYDVIFNYKGYKIEINWKNITSVENESGDSFSLISFPNPFANSTSIKYTLNKPSHVRINIYDNLGTKITTLKEAFQDAGERRAIFNAENYPQGMYFYTIQINERIVKGKLLLLR